MTRRNPGHLWEIEQEPSYEQKRRHFIGFEACRIHAQILRAAYERGEYAHPREAAKAAAEHATHLWIAIEEDIEESFGSIKHSEDSP